MQEYEKLVEAGTLRPDDYQTQIIRKLQDLHDALALYDPPPPAGPPSLVNISPLTFRRRPSLTSHVLSSPAFSRVQHQALQV
jgi:protein AFG1